MNLIIFSKNRPMQVECLIRSVLKNAPLFNEIHIQFTAEEKYKNAYQYLAKSLHSKGVKFHEEKSFVGTFKELISISGDKICLMVDDDIFFRKLTKWEVIKKEPFEILSLRLGDNIKQHVHLTYKASVDGNIFDKSILEKVVNNQTITNPNKLEVALIEATKPHIMKRLTESKIIGIPCNRVSETSGCQFMSDNTEDLNRMFNLGVRIDYENMDLEHNNVHKYIDYEFTKKFRE